MEILPELTILGEKGQVVIPKRLRTGLRLAPRARFVVYGSGDVIILKRLELGDLGAKWRQIMRAIEAKGVRVGARTVRRGRAKRRGGHRRAAK